MGISHLTTSRRLGAQPVKAIEVAPGKYRFDGTIPWVTAAQRADVLVTGAVLDDGRQMLCALPTDRAGVVVGPPFPLAALQASCTTEVVLEGVRLDDSELLAGPATDILSNPGAVGTAGLETSALALGQARAALISLIELGPGPHRPGRAARRFMRQLANVLAPSDRAGTRRARRSARRPDPHPGELTGSPSDAGLPDGTSRHRLSPDRARPAVGTASALFSGLVVPDARRPGRHS